MIRLMLAVDHSLPVEVTFFRARGSSTDASFGCFFLRSDDVTGTFDLMGGIQ